MPAGTYSLRSSLDGLDRVFAYRIVPGYPMVVIAGLAYDDITAQTVGIRDAGSNQRTAAADALGIGMGIVFADAGLCQCANDAAG